jgi:hypothetical protein
MGIEGSDTKLLLSTITAKSLLVNTVDVEWARRCKEKPSNPATMKTVNRVKMMSLTGWVFGGQMLKLLSVISNSTMVDQIMIGGLPPSIIPQIWSPSWLEEQQNDEDEVDTALKIPNGNIQSMNRDQTFAFDFVMRVLLIYKNSPSTFSDSLRLIVPGTAGSGKSHLINCKSSIMLH